MDTKAPLLIILSIGVAVAMYNASGAAAVIQYGPSDSLESGEAVREAGDNYSVEEGYEGQVNPSADSDIVGLILGSFTKFIGLLAIPGLLSLELNRLGLWWFAAGPIGILANIIVYIGGFQLATGRMYE